MLMLGRLPLSRGCFEREAGPACVAARAIGPAGSSCESTARRRRCPRSRSSSQLLREVMPVLPRRREKTMSELEVALTSRMRPRVDSDACEPFEAFRWEDWECLWPPVLDRICLDQAWC